MGGGAGVLGLVALIALVKNCHSRRPAPKLDVVTPPLAKVATPQAKPTTKEYQAALSIYNNTAGTNRDTIKAMIAAGADVTITLSSDNGIFLFYMNLNIRYCTLLPFMKI